MVRKIQDSNTNTAAYFLELGQEVKNEKSYNLYDMVLKTEMRALNLDMTVVKIIWRNVEIIELK